MSYDFNADELFEIAEQIERNGVKFYQLAANDVKDASHKELLNSLAAMEVQHIKTFADMRAELSAMEKETITFDPDHEAVQYLRALADTRVFFEKEIDTSSMKEILKSAIGAEKDSIVFYLGMKELVPSQRGSDKIDLIIKEEKDHIVILGKALTAL